MIQGEHGIQYMPCSSEIISEMLPEFFIQWKREFSQICNLFSNNLILCILWNLYYFSHSFGNLRYKISDDNAACRIHVFIRFLLLDHS